MTPAATLNDLKSDSHSRPRASKAVWAGRVLNALAIAFLVMDATMKLLQVKEAMEGSGALGWSNTLIFPIGVLEAVLLAVLIVPRTQILGAVLWTGYLGAAVATHVRVGSPLFSHVLFPVYVAAFIWGGLWLRDPRLRGVLAKR